MHKYYYNFNIIELRENAQSLFVTTSQVNRLDKNIGHYFINAN